MGELLFLFACIYVVVALLAAGVSEPFVFGHRVCMDADARAVTRGSCTVTYYNLLLG